MLGNIVLLLALSACPVDAWLTVNADVKAVCETLHNKYPSKLVWDPIGPKGLLTIANAKLYHEANTEYWNAQIANSRAACTFFPSNAEEVSVAVGALNASPEADYALKSGGHNPNPGFSSVDKGVKIAFQPNSQFVNVASDAETVEIGAGCRWEDVYQALEPYGKAVAGGRLGNVGVVGLTLGGGLSYLSAQYGFTCDNVVNFECVLANGTITNANAEENPELFFALRGGGNQFAVVTKITMKTFDSGVNGLIWGGVRTYVGLKHEDVIAAVSRFTGENKDPKAAIIPTFNFVSATVLNIPAILVFLFYDGPKPPPGIFDDFDAIHSLTDSTKTRTYESMSQELLAGDFKGLRFRIGFNSFPNLPADTMTKFLSDHYDLVREASTKASLIDLLDFKMFSFAIQPMPHGIVGASKRASGGNALGLKEENGDRVWIEYDIAWASPLCDGHCVKFLEKLVKDAHEMHVAKYSGIYPTNYKAGDLEFLSYNPIFMNDALNSQDVYESYGSESVERLLAAKKSYDPNGFFSSRQGGWRLPE